MTPLRVATTAVVGVGGFIIGLFIEEWRWRSTTRAYRRYRA